MISQWAKGPYHPAGPTMLSLNAASSSGAVVHLERNECRYATLRRSWT